MILGPIVGIDVAGVVAEVAEDSTSPFKVGDEVFGTCKGSLADRVRVSSASLGRKPKSLSFVQAAAMPTTYVTSLQALRGSILTIFAPRYFSIQEKAFAIRRKHHCMPMRRPRQVVA